MLKVKGQALLTIRVFMLPLDDMKSNLDADHQYYLRSRGGLCKTTGIIALPPKLIVPIQKTYFRAIVCQILVGGNLV